MDCSRALSSLLLAGLVMLAAPAAALDGFVYTREVHVAAPGWVSVPLDQTATIQHLAPGAADLHVFAPSGAEADVWIGPAAQSSKRREVDLVKVEKVADGWTLLFDAGPNPAPHERLHFAMVRLGVAPAVRLDGSADGKSWHPLATGDLFRLGEREQVQQLALSYSETNDRFLRLAWPQSAGLPRVEAVEVETTQGPSVTFWLNRSKCETVGQEADCRLDLSAAGQTLRRVTVEISGAGAVGFRLYEPERGTWHLLREGTWQRTEERTRHVLAGAPDPVAGDQLRLELFGGKAAPKLTGWGVDLEMQTVSFQAEEAGLYTLAYGGAVRRNHRAAEPGAGTEVAWLQAGPEKALPAAPLPEALSVQGAPLGLTRFESSWVVVSPLAKAGDLVRLELPDAVYSSARRDLGDLRVALGQEQIPFYRWSPADPAAAGKAQEARPAAIPKTSQSGIEVLLPASGLPLTELVLTTPGGPLRRTVGVRYLEPLRRSALPNDPREQAPVARTLWECTPEPPLPCREAIGLPVSAPKILSVRLDDGDNPPLAALTTEVWRRRDVLLFVWPRTGAGEPVRLLAGAQQLSAPAYDFASLGEILLTRPWQPAEVDLVGQGEASKGSRWAHWAMPIALTIAGVFLLLLLRSILSEH